MIIETIKIKEMGLFPELLIGISVIYLILYGLFLSYNAEHNFPLLHSSILNLSVLVISLSCFLVINENLCNSNFISFSGTITIDYLSFISKIVIGVASLICLIMIKQHLKAQKINSFEYTIVILFAVLGLFLLCSAHDFLTAYLAIELQSLSFYILAAFKKNSTSSVEGGLKYFILGAFSSGFFLFGVSLIYFFTGTTDFENLSLLYGKGTFFPDERFIFDYIIICLILGGNLLKWAADKFSGFPIPMWEEEIEIALNRSSEYEYFFSDFLPYVFLFVLVSLFFKLSLVPFHSWSPDVYESSPSSSTFFFSVVSKLGIFVLLIRLCYYTFHQFIIYWGYPAVVLAVLSVIVGSVAGIEQRKLKSLLAYSSISHIGYLILSFSSGNGEFPIQLLLCYLIIYTGSGLCIWSVFMLTRLNNNHQKKQNKDLADLVLLRKSNSALAIVMVVVLLSIAGLPPMIGFLVKMSIFLVALKAELYNSAIVAILFSVVSTFYYIRIVKIMYFEPVLVGKLYYPINSNVTAVLVSFLFFLLLLLYHAFNFYYTLTHYFLTILFIFLLNLII